MAERGEQHPMARPKRLSDEEVEARLKEIPGWALRDGKLAREFRFDDFVGAFVFMTALAMIAERLNHHPEWFNVYNRVKIELITHDVDGISRSDFDFATAANRLA